MRRTVLGLSVLLIVLAWPAAAGVLYSQPPVADSEGFYSDFQFDQQEADNFTLGSNQTIAGLRWWGDPDPGAAEDFTLRFFADAGGDPAVNPFVDTAPVDLVRTDTGTTNTYGFPIYEYTAALPTPLNVLGGTTYYLSIVDNATGGVPDTDWSWYVSAVGDDTTWYRFADNTAWSADAGDHAFELLDTAPIPEPGTWALLLIGGAAGVVRRRQAQRRH